MDRITALGRLRADGGTGQSGRRVGRSGLSRAMIGRHIQQLEDRLGVRLLNRTTRKQSLTEAGLAFFEKCSAILEQLTEAERAATELQSEPRGTLRVNGPMSFGNQHLATALAAYCERHPQVKIDLVLNDRQVDLVEEGYDVAIRIARLTDSSLIARRLAPIRIALCASPEYLRRHGTPQVPADLSGHNCLLYAYALAPLDWALIAPDGGEVYRPRQRDHDREQRPRPDGGRHRRSGHHPAADLHRRRCPAQRANWSRCCRTTRMHYPTAYAVYPHARNLSPKVRSFVDFLAEYFRGTPSWDAGLPATG